MLFGRKRVRDLSDELDQADEKKDELLALKLQELNDSAKASGKLQDLPIKVLASDPEQPRKTFRNIEALAKSIEAKGIIQPIVVSPRNDAGKYVIIAGERRYQAAKLAGLHVVPCIVRQETDADIIILQLLENDQREGVTPLEESVALSKLIDKLGMSKSQLAKELGRDPAWVSIRLGLQHASDKIKQLVSQGVIEDVRTLHELRKLEKENPKAAEDLVDKICRNEVSGSYRQVIAKARRQRRGTPQRVRRVNKIERNGNHLFMYVAGSKHPLQFELQPEVLDIYLEQVENA